VLVSASTCNCLGAGKRKVHQANGAQDSHTCCDRRLDCRHSARHLKPRKPSIARMMTIAPTHQTMLFTVCSSQPVEGERVVGSGTRTITTFE
jgi:hypothetical protein